MPDDYYAVSGRHGTIRRCSHVVRGMKVVSGVRRRRGGPWLVVLLTLVVVAAGCVAPFSEPADPNGPDIRNTTDQRVFVWVVRDDGEEHQLRPGLPPGMFGNFSGVDCVSSGPPVSARNEDGELVDIWDLGPLCEGDYWMIPHGGVIVSEANSRFAVSSPSTSGMSPVTVAPGRRGTLPGPCADPPIRVIDGVGATATRDEPLCEGDTWIITQTMLDTAGS